MIPSQERIFLYQYLARILNRKTKIKQALCYYHEDNVLKTKYRRALKGALFLFEKNNNFAQSLYQAKIIPHDEYLSLKVSGEQPKILPKILLALADNLNHQNLLGTRIKTLLIYPIILIIEFLIVLGISTFWLTPQLTTFLAKLKINLPEPLKLLIFLNYTLSQVTQTKFFLGLIIIPGLLWLFYQLTRLPKIKYYFDYLALCLPATSPLYQLIILQDVFNKLLLLIAGRRRKTIFRELKTIAITTKNLVYKKSLHQLASHLEKGGTLKQFWCKQKNRRLFPLLVQRLLTLSERSGNYEKEVQIIKQSLSQELENKLKRFISILEPALIILIALLVATLALTLQNILGQMQRTALGG